MKTKLTLSIESKTVNRAKRYARKRKMSLSHMLERYMQSLQPEKKATMADSLVGIIPEKNMREIEKIISMEARKKHGNEKDIH